MTDLGNQKTFLQRIRKWGRSGKDEKIAGVKRKLQILFAGLFWISKSKAAFLAFQPDSYYIFSQYPEFRSLLKKFSAYNKLNNGGDIVRLWAFILNIRQVLAEGIAGDFAELGVWRGNTAAILTTLSAGREVYLFDTFEGFSKQDLKGIDAKSGVEFADTSIELVKQVVGESVNCHFVKGYFPDSVLEDHRRKIFSVVSLDCDLYEPTKAGLEFFYPRMSRGGIFLLHDYSSGHWTGARQAIDEFCRNQHEFVVLLPDKSGSAFFRKSN